MIYFYIWLAGFLLLSIIIGTATWQVETYRLPTHLQYTIWAALWFLTLPAGLCFAIGAKLGALEWNMLKESES